VWGGAAAWLYYEGQTGWAVFMALWGFFLVSTVDNVIKPYLIARGAQLPFVLVLLGVLGGVLAFGVIGVFMVDKKVPDRQAEANALEAEPAGPETPAEGPQGHTSWGVPPLTDFG